MYNGLYNLLEMNSVIYALQFGFKQKCSTFHALIHSTDKITVEVSLVEYLLISKKHFTQQIMTFLYKNEITMALEEQLIIGFLHIFRIDRNMLT